MTNQARFTINSSLGGQERACAHHSGRARWKVCPGGAVAGLPRIEGTGPRNWKYRGTARCRGLRPARILYCQFHARPKSPIAPNNPRQRQPFKALLAAKRAIIKSGAAVSDPPEGRRSVEISFDGEGRPSHPGCLLSISHTGHNCCGGLFLAGRACLAGAGTSGRDWRAGPLPLRHISAQNPNFAFLFCCRC